MAKIPSRNFSPFCAFLGISVTDLQQLSGVDPLGEIFTWILSLLVQIKSLCHTSAGRVWNCLKSHSLYNVTSDSQPITLLGKYLVWGVWSLRYEQLLSFYRTCQCHGSGNVFCFHYFSLLLPVSQCKESKNGLYKIIPCLSITSHSPRTYWPCWTGLNTPKQCPYLTPSLSPCKLSLYLVPMASRNPSWRRVHTNSCLITTSYLYQNNPLPAFTTHPLNLTHLLTMHRPSMWWASTILVSDPRAKGNEWKQRHFSFPGSMHIFIGTVLQQEIPANIDLGLCIKSILPVCLARETKGEE